jgi:hypothetical protein
MFLKIKKDRGISISHNGMEKDWVHDVTSDFIINVAHIGEISFYTQQSERERIDLQGRPFNQAPGTRVIHLQMTHTYATFDESLAAGVGRRRVKVYYKLYFAPENVDAYQELRGAIESQVVNL